MGDAVSSSRIGAATAATAVWAGTDGTAGVAGAAGGAVSAGSGAKDVEAVALLDAGSVFGSTESMPSMDAIGSLD